MFLRSASLSSTPFIHPAKIMVTRELPCTFLKSRNSYPPRKARHNSASSSINSQVKAYSYLPVHEIHITFKTGTNGKLL